MTTPAVLPGAEPMSHEGTSDVGVLVLHGFTGNPSSMRGLAEAMAALGHHVEMPRLPGHGTTIDDMLDTTWADWSGEVGVAHSRLSARVNSVVVMGLSMGGSLTLWSALTLPGIDGLVCVNPATMAQPAEVIEMISEMVADGTEIAPAIGGDIADPDAVEIAYDGVPLRAMLSLMNDGLIPITDRFGELTMPLLLITSRQDHVVEPANSEHLAATFGGDVEHVWLERSYHVATQDYDADDINRRAGEFVARVTAG
ncbi:MAG TPA: alpha/beta fold hydrolase [Ilumatobacteraceae bacterium]|nr:alpha/beta fold hydrolase [Ilumatobacteraceae bacterium]